MKKNKIAIIILSLVCVFSVVTMTVALTTGANNESNGYTPPAFDETAKNGTPSVEESLGYSEIYQEGMGFTAYVCGNVQQNGSVATVYFTNDSKNTVWLKLRILDENNNILGESGIIKPNEYVEDVQLKAILANGAKIKLKIMAYEPDTYYSAGAVSLNTVIGKEK